jgi:uncharacterized integral membrane protein
MRALAWLGRAFIFFTLFAFALNNQQTVAVNWFFGLESRAPMVIVVLAAFAAGCVVGVVAMLPGWWRQRQAVGRHAAVAAGGAEGAPAGARAVGAANGPSTAAPSDFGLDAPRREGL